MVRKADFPYTTFSYVGLIFRIYMTIMHLRVLLLVRTLPLRLYLLILLPLSPGEALVVLQEVKQYTVQSISMLNKCIHIKIEN